jgi:thiol-disulfide isomerase/thioredoxin
MRLTLYGRADCELCDEMLEVVERVAGARGLRVEKVDVDGDPRLAAEYGFDIPVLCIDGEKVFQHRVTEAAVRARLGV